MVGIFSGHSYHTFDLKGRVTIPQRTRVQLGDVVTLMCSPLPTDRCIRVLPLSEWERITQKFAGVDVDDNPELYSKMRRQMFATEDGVPFDKQGRLLIPPSLREYAKLEKDVVIAGANRHVEIWDRVEFERFMSEGNLP